MKARKAHLFLTSGEAQALKPRLSPEERRAKREARRAAQRLESVNRARKMHDARIEAEAGGAVAAPAPPPGFYVGCSGWFYWHWKGVFYPEALAGSKWFAHYAARFRTVELNAPFYSWPTVATVRTWLRQAGKKKFIYTVKACELITHTKRFRGTKQLVRDFGFIADLLGPRMGCFLFQLPPSYRYTPARLKAIVGQLDPRRRNVVEFRHASWWNARVYAAFRKSGIIFCSCSGPRLPDELVTTAEDVYIRFHGTARWYRHDYSTEELEVWVRRIRQSGAVRVWAYFNNDRDGNAVRNARLLLRLLKKAS
jgi:uncharacterized protein YecE (DUF72 family)